MRVILTLVACSACLHTSVDTDGTWTSLDDPCVSVGATRELFETRFSLLFQPAGDTLLYSSGQTVSQYDLATGETRVVLRSDGISQFGAVGDTIVYYESNGSTDSPTPIDLIVDHGARSTSRYERISPRPNRFQAGLVTTPAGAYWWTSYDGDKANAEYWRWDPETGATAPFTLDSITFVRTDDDSFFYFDSGNRLIVRPQHPGPPDLVVEMDPERPPPLPIGIDGDELFYVNHLDPSFEGDLVARGADGVERVIVTDNIIVSGTLAPAHVYFTVDCGLMSGNDFDERCQNLYRVPRAGGPIETFFEGDANTTIWDVSVDGCNVYWQQFRVDGGSLYASEIMQ
ncbi:MAG: hypothetical protein ACKV2T_39165 [Kofleriaceae bacterium]